MRRLPGDSAQIPVSVLIPQNQGSEELTCSFEITSRESKEIEGRHSYTIPGGQLHATAEHVFENMQEKMAYTVINSGYTDKEYTVMVRDEVLGMEIYHEKKTIKGGEVYEGEAVSPNGMFAKDGCQNVTIYILFDGEKPEDADPNRVVSAVPLDEIYGQTPPKADISNEESKNGSDSDKGNGRGNDRNGKNSTPAVIPVHPEKTPVSEESEEPGTEEPDSTPQSSPDSSGGSSPAPSEAPDTSKKHTDGFPIIPVSALLAAGAGVLWRFVIGKRKKEDE